MTPTSHSTYHELEFLLTFIPFLEINVMILVYFQTMRVMTLGMHKCNFLIIFCCNCNLVEIMLLLLIVDFPFS